ncbi:MAG: hypothetical protein KAW41_00330 [Candidatus Diapherotrites archaeon]|nr:hypothetical protein [Candidatus Diapherotrites archaeon]
MAMHAEMAGEKPYTPGGGEKRESLLKAHERFKPWVKEIDGWLRRDIAGMDLATNHDIIRNIIKSHPLPGIESGESKAQVAVDSLKQAITRNKLAMLGLQDSISRDRQRIEMGKKITRQFRRVKALPAQFEDYEDLGDGKGPIAAKPESADEATPEAKELLEKAGDYLEHLRNVAAAFELKEY